VRELDSADNMPRAGALHEEISAALQDGVNAAKLWQAQQRLLMI
jgi:hypothetical protein